MYIVEDYISLTKISVVLYDALFDPRLISISPLYAHKSTYSSSFYRWSRTNEIITAYVYVIIRPLKNTSKINVFSLSRRLRCIKIQEQATNYDYLLILSKDKE